MGQGKIHIYEGDGKGKTTAAVGLAVRFAGKGGRVYVTQFLKRDDSGELNGMEEVTGITVRRCSKVFGFTFQMSEEEKQAAADYYTAHLHGILVEIRKHCSDVLPLEGQDRNYHAKESRDQEGKMQQPACMLVLDEVLDAYNQEMISRRELLDFLGAKPAGLEVVMTGRNPAPELLALADYVTYMEARKHPYGQGLAARPGNEW